MGEREVVTGKPTSPSACSRTHREIGWREWVSLPDLGIPHIKAKVDTGARSSAIHAFDLEYVERRGRRRVRFKVHPVQRSTRETVTIEADLHDERHVRNSGGVQSYRPVIHTRVSLLGESWPIELTLVARDEMGFRMLLGRQAIRGRFLVDAGRSFLGGKPAGVGRKKRKKKRRKTRKSP